MRTSKIKRQTSETTIELELNLDGHGETEIFTGIGFFDHMLEQLAFHGLMDIHLKAHGDLQIDYHHTIEDCSLSLGQAIDQALMERRGIVRMASTYVSMDEALAFVAIDFSGRPYSVLDLKWHSHEVGGIATTLLDHFFESFAIAARCNLHARLLYGRDDHHQAEALFKALGRALDMATQVDQRKLGTIPSTKGVV